MKLHMTKCHSLLYFTAVDDAIALKFGNCSQSIVSKNQKKPLSLLMFQRRKHTQPQESFNNNT